MIKNSTYIRSFTDKQKLQMKLIQDQHKLKTVPDILFFSLDQYSELKKDNERLSRLIDMRRKKEVQLQLRNDHLEQKLERIKKEFE